jgi:hypothetical protein
MSRRKSEVFVAYRLGAHAIDGLRGHSKLIHDKELAALRPRPRRNRVVVDAPARPEEPPAGAGPAAGAPPCTRRPNTPPPVPPPTRWPHSSASCRGFETHVSYALRGVAGPDARDELAAEAVALAWKHFAALAARGRHPEEFASTLARRCAQAARAGRRLSGGERARDALSAVARHRVMLVRLADRVPAPGRDGACTGAEVVAAGLLVDPRARVPDQAAFRLDFPVRRAALPASHRAAADLLAGGDGAAEAAARLGVTAARVSQLRRALLDSRLAFHGEG